MRLRKHTPKLGAFHAWNKCLNHVLALANAYIESVVGVGWAWAEGWAFKVVGSLPKTLSPEA